MIITGEGLIQLVIVISVLILMFGAIEFIIIYIKLLRILGNKPLMIVFKSKRLRPYDRRRRK
jgi:hypothetical protein